MAINTMEELDAYYHDEDVDVLDFPHISDTVQRILGGNPQLLPLFLSTIPLIHKNNITSLITTLRATPHFVFNSANLCGIIESIIDVHDFYGLTPERKESLLIHLFSILPLDSTKKIDEFINASVLSLEPHYHESIVQNITQYHRAKTLLPYFLFKKGVALHGINGYVDSFLEGANDAEKQMNLFILNKLLEHPDLSRAHMARIREKLSEYGGLHKPKTKRSKRTSTR